MNWPLGPEEKMVRDASARFNLEPADVFATLLHQLALFHTVAEDDRVAAAAGHLALRDATTDLYAAYATLVRQDPTIQKPSSMLEALLLQAKMNLQLHRVNMQLADRTLRDAESSGDSDAINKAKHTWEWEDRKRRLDEALVVTLQEWANECSKISMMD